MRPFAYARPESPGEAFAVLSGKARPKGGGYDLLDLAKNGVSSPETLVDLAALAELKALGNKEGRHVLGARLTLSDLAGSLATIAPAVADAAAEAATPLVRNVATLGGNLLQRPRCPYFRDPFFDCLKRGGKACPAMEGDHREGAIFGNAKCCAVHPSNLAVALVAAEAVAVIWTGIGEDGGPRSREAPLGGFFVPPEEDPLREARIEPGELLAAVRLRACPASAYVEVDQKQSFDWASAAAAVVLRLEGGKVGEARVVLGAVAPVPWRAEAAEAALRGRAPDEGGARAAAEAATEGAAPLRDNAHKVAQLRACVKRAVLRAAERGR